MAKEPATEINTSLPARLADAPAKRAGRQGKFFDGVVVKTAMKDTATVSVERYVKHPKYQKYQRRSQKFLVHDPGNTLSVGQKVTIRETRPISRRKRFVIAQ
ncbi:MAG: 30S ribosomal protein S17 [Candidatus Kaiserbacteria bacterium GW2011_GWB1_52_6]|uniref:30S ribosomal protein S17 n=3 Tax=Candidatus Kaiseribacteriota TaxID=1752734 RepID=A0A0G1XMF8_9BACT|nr:MAG: 30S ribosomal protein S17 [Candidatus Kaiserbacteria bacterium GW2011_GWA2_52_12]KKW26247.1 MAG: 30S ribosomal protein S17 [Candidatus Kaiserbacteria bacterium GW2011_GWB1_52_6]KKW32055.1 MAG: 30S ribosomal protein S17 [Candidatus Kaiserbacteria bacterium GW2011_GWC2_52_8b]